MVMPMVMLMIYQDASHMPRHLDFISYPVFLFVLEI